MGGSSVKDDWELTASTNETLTMVLVGRIGNGKSATGNSILGRKAFKSKRSSSAITSTCELQKDVLRDGQTINVIDSPGLFDLAMRSDFVGKEIVKRIDLAKEGIHAILVVLSVTNRFSEEEQTAFHNLQTLFGNKIVDYTIVVFTGGDQLEDDNETLEDYLGRECPEPLQTKDEKKKFEQVVQLLSLVDMVIAQNGGQPYMNEFFTKLKKGVMKLHNQQLEVDASKGYSESETKELKDLMQRTYDEQLKQIIEMIETKLKEATAKLEQQLSEEQAARLKAEENAVFAQKRSDDEIQELRENLEKAREELHKQGEKRCTIL